MVRRRLEGHRNREAIDMCDSECIKRFERLEIKVTQIANDMRWFKWLIRSAIVLGAAILGIDVSGVGL